MNGRLESRLSALEKATGAGIPRVIVARSPTETTEDARVRLGLESAESMLLVYTGVRRAENWQ